MGVLIPANALLPRLTDHRRVEHDVDLLGMVVRLGILVTVALDGDVRVYDHEFDMAGALLELVVDGLHLVFSDVVVDVEVLFLFLGEGRVEFVGDHFVGAALEGEKFTL